MYRRAPCQVRVAKMVLSAIVSGLGVKFYVFYLSAESTIYGKSGFSEELFYADDLALVKESIDCLRGKLEAWKEAVGSKGLTVNVVAKMTISGKNVGGITDS